LSSVLGVDLNAAVQQKLRSNELRYPADKVRGSSRKAQSNDTNVAPGANPK
jgi:dCTP diphosphatase